MSRGKESDDDRVYPEEEDGRWYIGKASEEFKRRRDQTSGHRRDDEDPVQARILVCVTDSLIFDRSFLVGKGP